MTDSVLQHVQPDSQALKKNHQSKKPFYFASTFFKNPKICMQIYSKISSSC